MENRIVPFTTRHLKLYKLLCIFLTISLVLTLIFFWKNKEFEMFYGIFLLSWTYLLSRYLMIQLSVKHISYDDSNFYVALPDYELQIGFEEVESIEIVSLGGVYRINLYIESMIGKQIYFKPSLLYPLNFKNIDSKIDRFRFNIARYKRNFTENHSNHLNSLNI